MVEVPHIEIKIDGRNTKIFIDGKELKGIRSYCLSQNSETKLPILQINLLAMDLSIDTKMIPALPEPYSPYYMSLTELVNKGIVTEEQLNKIDLIHNSSGALL